VSYSSDERDAAVSGLVKGTLSFSRDRLGPRDVNASFGEVQELVNTTLLYDQDAIFYLVYLASNRLRRLVNAELSTITELLDAVDDLLKPNKPLRNISGAGDAESALIALENAMSRSGGVSAQEYYRYTSSLKRLTDELGKTSKLTYVPRGSSTPTTDIVRPQAKAKADVRTHMDRLTSDHADLLAGVERMLTAFSGFQAQDLAATVAQAQLSRARQQMTSIKERLEALTPEERIEEARESLLEALGNKAVVRGVANAPESGGKKVYQKLGDSSRYRVRAYGEGTAPKLEGTVSGPFKLSLISGEEAHNLGLEMNGGAQVDFDLLPSGSSYSSGVERAEVRGGIPGPFVIRPELDEPENLYTADTAGNYGLSAGVDDRLHIIVDGNVYDVVIGTASSGTPTEIETAINNEAGLKDLVTASVVPGAVSGTRVQIEYDYTTPANRPKSYSNRFMSVTTGVESANVKLGTWMAGAASAGDTPKVTGWDGNDELWIKANDDDGYENIALPSGSYPDFEVSASVVAAAVDAAGGTEFGGSSVSEFIVVTSKKSGEGSIITVLSDGLILSGDRVNLKTASHAGMETLGFFSNQEDRQKDVDGRTVTNVLNGSSSFSAEASARMERVEYFRSRNGQKMLTILDPTHLMMAVAVASDPTADFPPPSELKLEVNNGDNRGVYQIGSFVWASGLLVIEVTGRSFRDTDTSLLYELTIYRDRMVIESSDSGTDGSLEIVAPVAGESAQAALGLPSGQVQSTVGQILVEYNDPQLGWKTLDVKAEGLRVEDALVREDTMSTVTSVSAITGARSGIVAVTPEVSPDLLLTTADGFYFRSAAAESHSSFLGELTSWKASVLPPYQNDVVAIDRRLSPILAVTPSKGLVDQAYTEIEGLQSKLTGVGSLTEVLDNFSVTMIQDVEDVLNALKERGYDRALEALINGTPADFLTMTSQTASFGRNAMRAMRETVIEDVNEPRRRGNQFETTPERLRAEIYDDKDPINDFSDLEGDERSEPAALELWRGLDDV